MRKFKLFAILLVAVLAFSACGNKQPEFTFNLEVSGSVIDPDVQSKFGAIVTNVPENVLPVLTMPGEFSEAELELAKLRVHEFVENMVMDEVKDYTTYDIQVTGYVHESLTGITLSVDKEFIKE